MTETAAELRDAKCRHVFLALVKVRNWFDGVSYSADEYCERDGYHLSETAHAWRDPFSGSRPVFGPPGFPGKCGE
jgi:hypothetical protein